MKTAREWFQTLPDDVANNAIANTADNDLEKCYLSLGDAIVMSFGWSATKEGHNYWEAVLHKVRHNIFELDKQEQETP